MSEQTTLSKTDLFALADDVFGNRTKSLRWLNFPNSRLNGAKPIDLLETEKDISEIAAMLWQINEGIYS